MQVNKILRGDVFELLDRIPDGSIDLLFTDPPYNISMEGTESAYKNGKVGMNFGEWDFDFDLEAWFEKVLPKLKPETGQALVFNSFLNMEVLARKAEDMGYIPRSMLHWCKTNPVPQSPERVPLNALEEVLWVTVTDSYTFNKQVGKRAEDGRFLASSHEAQNKRFHATQKPESLWQELMLLHSNRGDLILDTFSGSGVTAVVADELRRNFIGFELDTTYHKKSIVRYKKQKRKARSLWV